MLSNFINNTFTISIKWKEFSINKCKVRDIPKMLAFGDLVKWEDTVMQLKIYFDYVSSFISDSRKKKDFIKSIYLLDIDSDLDLIISKMNEWIYWEQKKASEWWNNSEKNIVKSLLFVKKYYWLSVEEMENLTLEQFWYYSEMVLAIEDPKEYAKKEMQDKAMNGWMTLDDIKNFILKK